MAWAAVLVNEKGDDAEEGGGEEGGEAGGRCR